MLCVCACSKWKHVLPPGALFISGSIWTGSELNLVHQGFGVLSPTSWGWTPCSFVHRMSFGFCCLELFINVQLVWWLGIHSELLWSLLPCGMCCEAATSIDGFVRRKQKQQPTAYTQKCKQSIWLLPTGCSSGWGEEEDTDGLWCVQHFCLSSRISPSSHLELQVLFTKFPHSSLCISSLSPLIWFSEGVAIILLLGPHATPSLHFRYLSVSIGMDPSSLWWTPGPLQTNFSWIHHHLESPLLVIINSGGWHCGAAG